MAKFNAFDIILILVVCIVGATEIIKASKSEKSMALEIIDRALDLIKYFIGEKEGSPTQRINLALGAADLLACVVAIGLIAYTHIATTKPLPNWLPPMFWVTLIGFIPILFFCSKYTRHRYPK